AVSARAGVSHRQRAHLVLVRVTLELIFKAIAGPAAAGTGRVASLDHKIGDDTVKHGAIVELFAREKYKIVDRLGGLLGIQFADDFSAGGGECGGVFLV